MDMPKPNPLRDHEIYSDYGYLNCAAFAKRNANYYATMTNSQQVEALRQITTMEDSDDRAFALKLVDIIINLEKKAEEFAKCFNTLVVALEKIETQLDK